MSVLRDPLDAAALSAAVVPPSRLWTELRIVSETGSTNADVAAEARRGASEGLVLVADHQTAGRGRLARPWSSPPGAGLAVSMLLRPIDVPTQRWPWLPLLVGVAVAEAMGRVGLLADLKWPNDVLVGEAKLGGILVERVEVPAASPGAPSGAARPGAPLGTAGPGARSGAARLGAPSPAAVVGVGINVTNGPEEMPPGATSLRLAGAPDPSRARTLIALLDEVEEAYLRWRAEAGRPEHWLAEAYRTRCATIGREVRVMLPADRILTGWAVDIDEHGRLVVDPSEGGEPIPIEAGDIIHVR